MSDSKTKDEPNAIHGKLAKQTKGDLVGTGAPDIGGALKEMGFGGPGVDAPMEQIQTGGVTRWLDLSAFMENPDAPQNAAVKGNGKFFAGILLGRQEMEDEQGEENADGIKVRHFYTFQLATPCPVTFKDEEGATVKAMAAPRDIIAVGERHALRGLRERAEDGGQYAIVIKPHSRIRIARGQTMWTFEMWQKIIRAPMKVRAELVKPPF